MSSYSISRWMELSQCDWMELVFHLFSGDVFNFGRLCRSNKRMIREDGTNQSDPRQFNESKDLQHKPISTAHWGGNPRKNSCCLEQLDEMQVTKLLSASIRITEMFSICVIKPILNSDNIIIILRLIMWLTGIHVMIYQSESFCWSNIHNYSKVQKTF